MIRARCTRYQRLLPVVASLHRADAGRQPLALQPNSTHCKSELRLTVKWDAW
jgi:hypothetical protein